LGLALGIVAGGVAHAFPGAVSGALVSIFDPIGALWTNALRATVIPMTVCLLVAGIGALPSGKAFAGLAGRTFAVFAAMLVGGAALALGVGALYLPRFGPAQIPVPGADSGVAPPTPTLPLADWLQSLVPSNVFEAAVRGDLLPIAVMAAVFGLAIRSLPELRREPLLNLFSAARDALLVIVGWLLWLLPIGAFALAFSFSAESGFEVAKAAAHFTIYTAFVVLLATALLYPLAAVFGRVGLVRFATAAAPAQTVAAGTRSSLASLPATIESAQSLELPEQASTVVLPTAVSVFKPNRTITTCCKLLFVATLFGIELDPARIFGFVVTVILLSFATPGLPSASSAATLGAYTSAGLPVQGVLLFEAVGPLTDVFKTVYNVTSNLFVATVACPPNTEAEQPEAERAAS
jgi:Na+/H+-dicarboxylate symporter